MSRADVYLQPDAPDPVLSPDTVLDIASRHTQRATAVLEVDESGGEARAYLLSGDVVVKTQRPHRLRPRTSLAKEALILRHLTGPLGSQVPELFGHGRADLAQGQVEYLVMSRMPLRGHFFMRQRTGYAGIFDESTRALDNPLEGENSPAQGSRPL